MEKIEETTKSPNVVAVVQCQINVSENKGSSGSTLEAERAAMRSAIIDFPQYGPQIARQNPLRILIAEDSLVNMKITLWFLRKLGYRPDIAFNGMEVLDAIKRRCYDVIFMDAEMPEMDGREATIAIRQSYPANLQPHIIAMTANCSEGDEQELLSIGMNDFIAKPIKIERLVQVLISARPLPATSPRIPLAALNDKMTSMVA